MAIGKQPCDDGVIRSQPVRSPCMPRSQPWVLAATILGSSLAMIDSTVVNVALPALQTALNASTAQVQWVVEAYALLLAALILGAGRWAIATVASASSPLASFYSLWLRCGAACRPM